MKRWDRSIHLPYQWCGHKATDNIWYQVVHCITGVQRMSCLTEATISCWNCCNSGWFFDFQTSNFITGYAQYSWTCLVPYTVQVQSLNRPPKVKSYITTLKFWSVRTYVVYPMGTISKCLKVHCIKYKNINAMGLCNRETAKGRDIL